MARHGGATSMKLLIANHTDSKFQTFPPRKASYLFLSCEKHKRINQASYLSFSNFMAFTDFHSYMADNSYGVVKDLLT